jgi:hypothetical protein
MAKEKAGLGERLSAYSRDFDTRKLICVINRTQYAELLSDMYHQTLNAVNEHDGSL